MPHQYHSNLVVTLQGMFEIKESLLLTAMEVLANIHTIIQIYHRGGDKMETLLLFQISLQSEGLIIFSLRFMILLGINSQGILF